MKQKKEDRLVMLLAKTGVFFANCDNNYDEKEHSFIIKFTQQMVDNSFMTAKIKEDIEHMNTHSISIDMLIRETEDFIEELLKADEKKIFIELFKEFIEGVISSDKVLHTKESEYFEMWKNSIK